ncbi:MAG: hypothetical protein IT320_12760 [Anaerolineae bacterium]|nr:hypothetical protein [Anaerolineae bacterium]
MRQTVAYLCNLLDTANQCFGDFDAGNTQTDVCDPESEVWRDATPYEALTWPGLYAELRRLTQELLAHAVAADTQKRAGDLRYRKWLTRLSVDCVEMMHQLEESLDMDSRQQT